MGKIINCKFQNIVNQNRKNFIVQSIFCDILRVKCAIHMKINAFQWKFRAMSCKHKVCINNTFYVANKICCVIEIICIAYA